VYYRARERALRNGHRFHVAAILRRSGNIVRIGTNSDKTHPKFKRTYPDGSTGAHMHAEMDVIRFARSGDELEVMRFRRSDNMLAMAKPCRFCMKHIREAGITSVSYTDDDGVWKRMKLKETGEE